MLKRQISLFFVFVSFVGGAFPVVPAARGANNKKLSDIVASVQLTQDARGLSQVDLSSKGLTELDAAGVKNLQKQFPNIEVLALHNNELNKLPKEIAGFKKLKRLVLFNNQFKEFPEVITELTSLEYLWMSGNYLRSLPESIGNLVALKQFTLPNNCISSIPESIQKLKDLVEIDLSHNILRFIPPKITDILSRMTRLRYITLVGNPLGIPKERHSRLKRGITDDEKRQLIRELKLQEHEELLMRGLSGRIREKVVAEAHADVEGEQWSMEEKERMKSPLVARRIKQATDQRFRVLLHKIEQRRVQEALPYKWITYVSK